MARAHFETFEEGTLQRLRKDRSVTARALDYALFQRDDLALNLEEAAKICAGGAGLPALAGIFRDAIVRNGGLGALVRDGVLRG